MLSRYWWVSYCQSKIDWWISRWGLCGRISSSMRTAVTGSISRTLDNHICLIYDSARRSMVIAMYLKKTWHGYISGRRCGPGQFMSEKPGQSNSHLDTYLSSNFLTDITLLSASNGIPLSVVVVPWKTTWLMILSNGLSGIIPASDSKQQVCTPRYTQSSYIADPARES